MTETRALEILRNSLLCRTTDCDEMDCEMCEYEVSFDEINRALETAIKLLEGRVKECRTQKP